MSVYSKTINPVHCEGVYFSQTWSLLVEGTLWNFKTHKCFLWTVAMKSYSYLISLNYPCINCGTFRFLFTKNEVKKIKITFVPSSSLYYPYFFYPYDNLQFFFSTVLYRRVHKTRPFIPLTHNLITQHIPYRV